MNNDVHVNIDQRGLFDTICTARHIRWAQRSLSLSLGHEQTMQTTLPGFSHILKHAVCIGYRHRAATLHAIVDAVWLFLLLAAALQDI